MPRRKSDAEVGVLGVWAYNTRDLLGLSSEQVAKAVGVSDATIRKIEGGSTRSPSARLLRDISRLFQETGRSQGIPVDPPPGRPGNTESPATSDGAGLSALPGMLVAQAEAFTRLLDAAARRDLDVESRLRAMEGELQSLRERLGVPAPGGQSAPLGIAE